MIEIYSSDSSPQRRRVRKGFYKEIFSLRALRLCGEPYKNDRIPLSVNTFSLS